MATPVLIAISKDLAYKLQDPVSTGTTDGVRLSADERLRYIIRAYRRLLRIVTMLYPNLTQRLFHNYYTTLTKVSTAAGLLVASDTFNFTEVFDIYCKQPSDEDYSKARFVSPEMYYDVETGQNKFYTPDLNVNAYYWTKKGADIQLFPPLTLNSKIMYRPDTAALIESGGYGGTNDIDVPTEYIDLILTLACAEAYLDIGQADLVQGYKSDLSEQLAILARIDQKKEAKDETDKP